MRSIDGSRWDRPELAEEGRTPTGEFRVSHAFVPAQPSEPQAYLVRSHSAAATVSSHFHEHDQFQVFVEGGGTFQRHDIETVSVHFTDAYSVYGPIIAGPAGLGFYVLRPCAGQGAHYMPGSRDQLVTRGRRNLHHAIGDNHLAGGVTTVFEDGDGLLCEVARLDPGGPAALPNVGESPGCYTLVINGRAIVGDAELGRNGLIYRASGDQDVSIRAGAVGATTISMRFPQRPRSAPVEEGSD